MTTLPNDSAISVATQSSKRKFSTLDEEAKPARDPELPIETGTAAPLSNLDVGSLPALPLSPIVPLPLPYTIAVSEEEQLENSAAATQAEEDIEVDTSSDSASVSDAGYETDSLGSSSTSISSSVRDFAFENGRRYHKFREGSYNFPNDDSEQDREDMKHAMVINLCQRLHFAPIGERVQNILDMGTGTGIWAIES